MSRDYRWLEILSHAISTVSLFIRLMASWSYLTALRYECERWRERDVRRWSVHGTKVEKEIGALGKSGKMIEACSPRSVTVESFNIQV